MSCKTLAFDLYNFYRVKAREFFEFRDAYFYIVFLIFFLRLGIAQCSDLAFDFFDTEA